MKLLITFNRPDRAARRPAASSDDSLGRGMDVALTLLVFLGLGALIDRWLGIFPVFTIALMLFAAIGSFIRMKYVYDAAMERHEAERMARHHTPRAVAPATGTTSTGGAA
ncbi:MAG: AtpZ/AtpI family protein [Ilumatobacter sp.]